MFIIPWFQLMYICQFPDAKGHKRNRSDEGLQLVTVRMTPTDDGLYLARPRTNEQEPTVIPVTAHVVGKVMSRDDLFYTPHKSNPFASRYKDCGKIVARDSWSSMMDLPSPSLPFTPPCTPLNPGFGRSIPPRLRRCHSLPDSPTPHRFDLMQVDQSSQLSPRTFSEASSIKKMELDTTDDSYDAHSDGSSSNDSAVEIRSREMIATSRTFSRTRINSGEPSPLNVSWEGRGPSRTELLTRCMEARLAGHDWLPLPSRRLTHHSHLSASMDDQTDGVPCSYSSSESFMSLDECSILSPTGSLSSYSETDSEIWLNRSHFEFYESRLRSRERFQELVRRWEAKQAAGGEGPPVEPPAEPRPLHGIKERNEPCDLQMEKRFKELRQRWEAKNSETSSSSSTPKS